MEFSLESVVVQPSVNKLKDCTKDQLLGVDEYFEVGVSKQSKKAALLN